MTRKEIDQRRADFVAGWARSRGCRPDCYTHPDATAEAAKRFPYPTQPRVVTCSDGRQYRILGDVLQMRTTHGDWQKSGTFESLYNLRLIASLIDHPLEGAS